MSSNSLNQTSLEAQWKSLLKHWLHLKEQAIKTNDYTMYLFFLKELRKEFSKAYAGFTNEKWIALLDQVFNSIACELKEIVIKSNNMPTPIKKKMIKEMTDEELVQSYKTGFKWISDKQQVTGTTQNELGEPYNDEEWQKGLKRIERIENEMQKRGLVY